MPIVQTVALMLFVVLVAILLVRYVHASVDREFQNLARAVSDSDHRADELAHADRLLDGHLPIPPDVKTVAAPESRRMRLVIPTLMFLGVALLWGGIFAREDRALWLWGALICCLASAAMALATLGRRKWERLARLLRYRADLRRLDGNRKGSAEDLRELMRLTPWDDAAWAELSDDLASLGRLHEAQEAAREASRLDPGYDDYRMNETSLAIRLGKLEDARAALIEWAALPGGDKDPRVAIYRAALELAEGRRDAAARTIGEVAAMDADLPREIVEADQALAGIKDLLPERSDESPAVS